MRKIKNLKTVSFAIAVFAAATLFGNVETVRAQRASMEWRGTVDDVVQIRIRNRNARTQTISGRTYNDENFNFDGRPPRENANVSVEKRNGRGQIIIVQRPNRRNNYTTLVQIIDKKGGPDRYRFTLYWD